MLNSFNVIGRCTKDGSLKNVGAKGTALLTFAIANNTGWGNQQKTNFFDVQMWGQRAVGVADYIKKGKQVAITGKLECNKWIDQEGMERQNWVINADDITLLADSSNAPQQIQQRGGNGNEVAVF